jgi:hypothetical protein
MNIYDKIVFVFGTMVMKGLQRYFFVRLLIVSELIAIVDPLWTEGLGVIVTDNIVENMWVLVMRRIRELPQLLMSDIH